MEIVSKNSLHEIQKNFKSNKTLKGKYHKKSQMFVYTKRWIETVYRIIKGGKNGHNPDKFVSSFLDISPTLLNELGVIFLIIDLDQTIVPHGSFDIDKKHRNHLKVLGKISEKTNICFLTNRPDHKREYIIDRDTGIKVISGTFRKPQKQAYQAAINYLKAGEDYSKIVMIGDRVWTDIIGARCLGIKTIQVKAICPAKDPLLTSFMRLIEKSIQHHGIMGILSLFFILLTTLCGTICSLYD